MRRERKRFSFQAKFLSELGPRTISKTFFKTRTLSARDFSRNGWHFRKLQLFTGLYLLAFSWVCMYYMLYLQKYHTKWKDILSFIKMEPDITKQIFCAFYFTILFSAKMQGNLIKIETMYLQKLILLKKRALLNRLSLLKGPGPIC